LAHIDPRDLEPPRELPLMCQGKDRDPIALRSKRRKYLYQMFLSATNLERADNYE
jgi:hypothetical protein